MKKTGWIIVSLLLIISVSSCKKIDELLTFNIVDMTEFTIASSYGTGINLPLVFNSPDVQTSSSETFSNNNTKADLVKDVKLTTLDLMITSPSDKTFSFLKSAKIYISGGNLPEKLLASKENIPDDIGSKLSLETTSDKLDDYVKLSSYSLRYEIVTDQTFTEDITMKVFLVFRVTADPL